MLVKTRRWGLTAAAGVSLAAAACKTSGVDSALRDAEGNAGGAVCSAMATYDGSTINNYGNLPMIPTALTTPAASGDAARATLASFFPEACREKVADHLKTKRPNIYVYFTGFGNARQDNVRVDEANILRWINDRDPGGLIFSVSWDCQMAAAAGQEWCADHAERIAVKKTDPEFESMQRSFEVLAANQDEATKLTGSLASFAAQYQVGYNSALAHSILNGAQLIDAALKADEDGAIGRIHVIGYSMGAHAAADILMTDFAGDGSGYKWSRTGQCETSGDACTVAGLKKVNWSLALGLSGWSDALRTYNASPARSEEDWDLYRNGGLLRIRDAKYRSKLNVFNRRMDPTGNSVDTFERAIGDVLLSEYNHYAHDYTNPPFGRSGFKRELDAFLEASNPKDLKELGIYYDGAGLVDFDECDANGACAPETAYLAHEVNRSHGNVKIMKSTSVPTVAGVPQIAWKGRRAADFSAAGGEPLVLYTMDQEDLRGAVEMLYSPKEAPSGSEVTGLFSYGSCQGTNDDLMPQAYIKDGKIVFEARYLGKSYKVQLDTAQASTLAPGKWAHLSFAWEMPTRPMTVTHSNKSDLEAKKGQLTAPMAKHGKAIMIATGLRRPSPTTFREQKGRGKLEIWVNGKLAASAPLGTNTAARDCLSAADVLNDVSYDIGGGTQFPPHLPYANYNKFQGDYVALGPQMVLGSKCKGFKTRNTKVFVGCAKSDKTNARGYIDDVMIVFGPGRRAFDNVDKASGMPQAWPMGVSYDDQAFRAPQGQ